MIRRSDEGGAVALTVGVLTTVLVGIASFAIDLGMARVSARDMQALSDVVALDMAREIKGRTFGVIQADLANWNAAKDKSVGRNDDTFGEDLVVTAEPGTFDYLDGGFDSTIASGDVPNAVRVTSGSRVDYVLRPGSSSLVRTAVATTSPGSCFQLGSYGARLATVDSPLLGPILGAIDSDLSLGVLDYRGLALLDLRLGDLAAKLNAGSVSQLAGTEVTLSQFYVAMAQVLQDDGDPVQASLLQTLSAKVSTVKFKVGDVIDLTTAGQSALDATFNVLDLFAGSAQVANGDYGVAVTNLGVTLPGVTSLNGDLHLTETPRPKCGPPVTGTDPKDAAKSTQFDLNIGGTLLDLPSVLGAATTSTGLDVHADVAQALGWLREVDCGNATDNDPEGLTVSVRTSLANASVRVPLRVAGNISVLGTGYDIDLHLLISTSLTAADNSASYDWRVPPDSYGTPRTVGSSGVSLPAATVALDPAQPPVIRLTALGIPIGGNLGAIATVVNPVLSAVTSTIVTPIVTPIVNSVNDLLLNKLAPLLGLKLGGADLLGIPRPSCDNPSLSG